jgi:hypothetical protein
MEKYKCPRCEAGEPVIGNTFHWHGYTPQESFKNAEQCFDGFPRDVVEILLMQSNKYIDLNPKR